MSVSAISMVEPKEKLRSLQGYLPDARNELVYPFGAFLADYLNDELVPEGFVMGCELALNDLHTGVNGFSGEPIRGKLAGYPPIIYGLLRMEIPTLADAVLPIEFAEEVKDFIERVNAQVRAGIAAESKSA